MSGWQRETSLRAGAERDESDSAVLRRLLSNRFSCRGYLPTQVPTVTIESILELAQMVPSGCNSQPWHVTITSGGATERFRQALTEQARNNPPSPDLPFPREYRGPYRDRRRDGGRGAENGVLEDG